MNREPNFAERATSRIVKGIVKALMFVVLMALILAVCGFGVMWLWNWLMPGLFGLHQVGYWQALGILILSRILFAGFRGGRPYRRHDWSWRRRMFERWERMTPEEREKFREGMRRRCGFGEPPAETPTA
jgi:hypothetical protein